MSGTRFNKVNDPSVLLMSSEEDDEEEEVVYNHPQKKVSQIKLPILNTNFKSWNKDNHIKT